MSIAAARSRLFGLGWHQRSETTIGATSPRPNAPQHALSVLLCWGALTIGAAGVTGYALGNAAIASCGYGKPIAGFTSFILLLLGAGLLSIRSSRAGVSWPARWIALAVVAVASVDVLVALLSPRLEVWHAWGMHGTVYLQPYPITVVLLLAEGGALYFLTTGREFVAHAISSALLLFCVVYLFAYTLRVPEAIENTKKIVPVFSAIVGLILIVLAQLIERPRGWMIPIVSATSAGVMTRILLPTAFAVPLLALSLRDLMEGQRWFTPEIGLTVIVVVNVFFSGAVVLAAGMILHKREVERVRLAALVASSGDAIIGKSSTGLIESWNPAAERLYGYTAAEAIGRPIEMLAPPERRDEVPRLLERARRGERVEPFETTRMTKDGRRVDVWLSIAPILDARSEVVGISTIAHDLTDRKKAEEEVRRLAEQYATMLATSSDGFLLIDLEGRLLDVNDAYCRMSGYTRSELLSLHLSDIRGSREEIAAHLQAVAQSGFARFETTHRTKDGRLLDIEASVSLWRSAGLLLQFARDITEKKRAIEALRRSEERLQLSQRAGGIGHFSWDIQNNVNEWSDELMALYGLAPGSFGGKYESWRERLWPEDVREAEEHIQRSLTSGEFYCDFRVVWPDSSVHWLHARAKVFFSDDGKPSRMVGVNMDITARREAEAAFAAAQEAARKSGEQLKGIIDNITDLIATLDTSFRFVAFNEAYARQFKTIFGKDIAIGDSLIDALAHLPQEQANAVAIWSRALQGEEFQVVEEFGDAALQRIPFEIRFSSLRDRAGQIIGATHVVRDVSERIRLERLLADKAADLERSNKELEQFAYVASHDLQEPLRMVSSYTQLLEQRYGDKLDADAHDFIQFAVDGATRMQRLIADLLTYSRIGTRLQPFRPVDTHAILGNAIANLRMAIEESAALVTCDELPFVNGDESQLVSLFQNLIANGIKFQNRGTRPRIHVSATAEGAESVFTVRDNGIGIPTEFRPRLFSIFQRGHGRAEFPGNGIGLAVCKRIVALHGGRIWLDPAVDSGTTIHFTLSTAVAKEAVNAY